MPGTTFRKDLFCDFGFALGSARQIVYPATMDHDRDDTPHQPPPEWLDALDRAEADVAAGHVVPWLEARARLLATIAEAETPLVPRQA